MTAQDQPYAPVFTDGAALGLIACRACGHTVRRTPDTRCDRCGARIRPPRPGIFRRSGRCLRRA
jgi:rubrerythrin